MTNYEDGVFEGKANGYHDLISAQVFIQDGKIEKIEYQHKDTPDTGGLAIQHIVEEIVKKQSTDIPRVPGARYSSIGILESVKKALKVSSGEISSKEAVDVYLQQTDGGYSTENEGDMLTKASHYEEQVQNEKLHIKGGSLSVQQISSILRMIPEKVYVYDQHGKLQFFNKVDEEPKEFNNIGKHIVDLISEEEQNDFFKKFNQLKNQEIKEIKSECGSVYALTDNEDKVNGYLQMLKI